MDSLTMPGAIPIPTKEELETPRSAKDLLHWAVDRLKQIGSTKEGRSILRLGKDRLAKALAEEVLPIGIFAARHFEASPDVEVEFKRGNQNYDAIVMDRRAGKSTIEYIEVTQAHEGELEHLRMVVLERDGRVGLFDKITKSGTKKMDPVVDSEPGFKNHEEVRANELQKILEAAQRKKNKQYPPNTALVIPFDDFLAIREGDVKQLDAFVRAQVLPEVDQFRWLGLVGWSQRIFEEYDLARPRLAAGPRNGR